LEHDVGSVTRKENQTNPTVRDVSKTMDLMISVLKDALREWSDRFPNACYFSERLWNIGGEPHLRKRHPDHPGVTFLAHREDPEK
jgi:hypothetical protein